MQPHDTTHDIPYGYCHCGCGQLAPITPNNNATLGYVKGQPRRFIHGHNHPKRKRPTAEQRLWGRVEKRGPDDCWEWQGNRDSRGYGRFRLEGKSIGVHRAAYILTHGPISADRVVCHRCDNPACCNPAHLFLGTTKDNVQDMIQKGRDAMVGSANSNAKLTEPDVIRIREMAQTGMTYQAIADHFNVTISLIGKVVTRRMWNHV